MPPQEEHSDVLDEIARPGDVIANKYRIERVIGTGGMGVVVQAFHLHFEERVAIKFLHKRMGANEEAIARFEREARAAFKIKSEHIARVIDVGKLADGMPFMVMEYLDGIDLADVLARDTRLSFQDAVSFVMQAAEAVAEAHTLGIVHRDLKPENLFLTQRSDGSTCVKVLDFGLSKMNVTQQSRKRERTLTASTQPMGTPQYMSPEQWMSAKDVGPATDIWSLGVILHELLTGVQPFHKEQLAQLCTMVLQVQPAPIGSHILNAPDAVQRVIDRCLMKKPSERYPHVAALALELYNASPDPQLHASAKRIAGVCRRAGMDVRDTLPDGTAAPSALMVLGYAPPSSDGSDRGERPSRGRAYESDTQIMPDSDTIEEDLARTVPHSDLMSPLRDDTGPTHRRPEQTGQPEETRQREDSERTHRREMETALGGPGASGQHPAVPAGDAGSSGRFAAYPGDASASGNFAAQRRYAPATSAPAGLPAAGLQAEARAKPRADTAQSWHRLLGASQSAQGAQGAQGSRRVALAVGSACVLIALVATVAIVGGGEGVETSPPDVTHAPAAGESGPAAGDPALSETDEELEGPQAGASTNSPPATAAPSASASGAAPAPPPAERRPVPGAVRPKLKPPVVRSQPKRPVDIFSDR